MNWQVILERFLKFGAVGFSGLIIDFGLTWLVKEQLRWNKYVANSLGFAAAASSNYFLNRIWTFQNEDPEVLIQYSKFILVAVSGLIINNLIVYIINDRLHQTFYLSKAIAILVVMFWNFSLNYVWTFV